MKYRLFPVVLAVSMVGGCVTDGHGQAGGGINKEAIGTVLGGLAGGLLGAQFGSGDGRLAAVAVGTLAGGFLGNQIGASLDEADRLAIQRRSATVLSHAKDGETSTWSNPDTGASAVIRASNTRTEKRSVPIARPKSVLAPEGMRLIGSEHIALKSSNVRRGPGTDYAVVSGLKPGERFTAVGSVQNGGWILVGKGRRTVGYVAAFLVQEETAAETVVTEATMREPINLDELETEIAATQPIDLDEAGLVTEEVVVEAECRTMEMSVTNRNGAQESSQYEACKGSDGAWEIL